ncbi:porin family protein [Litoribrevibacter euphylliae]|uniref:Porin family protein n=1 Tax=Litoribrevibacter euphylliae TaxID=1834034 RepID=A0ABV7HG84_9GAMM
MFKKLTLSAALLAATSIGFAQEGEYAKGGYIGTFFSSNSIEVDGSGYDIEAEPTSFGVRAGYYLIPQVALEVRYSVEVSDDNAEVNNIDSGVDVSLPYNYGAFIKAGYPTKHIEPYILLGWNKFELEAEANGYNASTTDSGAALGLGLGFFFNESLGMNLEVLSVHSAEEDDVEETIGQASLGLVYSF